MMDTTGATLRIIEPNHDGHRLYFVKIIAQHAHSQGLSVTLVTTTTARDSSEFAIHLGSEFESGSLVVHARPDAASVATSLSEYHGDDTIDIIPDADRLLFRLLFTDLRNRLTRQPLNSRNVLLMRFGTRHAIRDSLVRTVKRVLLRTSRYINPGTKVLALAGPLADTPPNLPSWILPIYDPIPSRRHIEKTDARNQLGLHHQDQYFLVAGRISARKSIPLLLESWSNLAPDAPCLLLAGLLTPHVRTLLEGSTARQLTTAGLLQVRDEYVTEPTLDLLFAAVDCLLLAYDDQPSSGLAGRAVAARIPILATGNTYVVGAVERYSLGWTCAKSVASMTEALTRARLALRRGTSPTFNPQQIDLLLSRASERGFAAHLISKS